MLWQRSYQVYLNQVYEEYHDDEAVQLRVVFIHTDFLMLIDINDENAWPFKVSTTEFANLGLTPIDDPIFLNSPAPNTTAEQYRDRAFSTISPLLDTYFDLFDKKRRNERIKTLLTTSSESRLYVTRQLRRYWQRGMSPDALAPDYSKCGAPGQVRRNVKNKAGAKRTVSPGKGTVITEDIADLFRLAIEGFYLLKDDIDLVKARIKAIGYLKSKYPKIDKSELPTDAQFRYFFQRNYLNHEVIQAKTSQIIYEKDIAPLKSTATVNNFGPGARYEIDATISDIYLISEHDPDRIIGRPIMYKVKDVFSRMTVGLYVGLENPSWATATIALANAFCDKVEYCRRYGIEISASDWPSIGIPASITADRGEMLGKHGDILVNRFGITLTNTRAYHGNDKGVIERTFKTTHVDILPYAKGRVEAVNGKKKAGKRNELEANMTLSEFTKLVILAEINRNNNSPVKGYDFEADMPTDLPAIPLKLWNWGIANRTGVLRRVDQKTVTVNLLPHEKATVSVNGINFKGLFYTCEEALRLGWFHRNKANARPNNVQVAYNTLDTNTIYLRPDNQFENYWVCTLHPRSRRYENMTFIEAASILKESNQTTAIYKQEEDYIAPDLQVEIEKIVQQATDRQKRTKFSKKTHRLQGIDENRDNERNLERNKNRIEQTTQSEVKHVATVTTIHSDKHSKQDFSYPDLDDF